MARVYANLIRNGKKKIEEVPEKSERKLRHY